MSLIPGLSGAVVLAAVWLGPLPDLSRHSFAAHMTQHIALVALAAPLLAWGVAGSRIDPVRAIPAVFAPIPASMVELAVVWGWHAPGFHQAARLGGTVFILEQVTFLAAGLLLWLSAVGASRDTQRGLARPTVGAETASERWRAAAGIGALLFTSIHMTLLGALFALAPRALYAHGTHGWGGLAPLADQQLGGVIMLLVGGAAYLIGALWLTAGVLCERLKVAEPLRAGILSRGG